MSITSIKHFIFVVGHLERYNNLSVLAVYLTSRETNVITTANVFAPFEYMCAPALANSNYMVSL